MKRIVALIVGVGILLLFPVKGAHAQHAFDADVAPVLKTFCFSCHGGAKPKSGLALDKLTPDIEKNADAWKGVLERISDGSMPPKGKDRPSAAQVKTVSEWALAGLIAYQTNQAARSGRARLRRLNRIEYANTIRDLLGVEVDIEALPEDGIASGFDNVDGALDLSANLLERYLESADQALDTALVTGAKPQAAKRHIDMVPLAKQITKTMRPMPRYGMSTQIRDKDVLFVGANEVSKPLLESKAGQTGRYRFRISANAVNQDKPMTLILYAGNYGMGVQGLMTRPLGMYDVLSKPTIVEFTARLTAKESIRIFPHGMPNVYMTKVADSYAGPGLAIQWIEVEGPLVDVWPPAASTRLRAGVDLSKGTLADAETILGKFAPRAFRRPLKEGKLAPFVNIVKSRLAKGRSFEDALRVGLKGILCSPNFLYLTAAPGKLNDFALAARLSYFLWSTTPDDALADVAATGKREPEVLRQQVERMLNDPKSHAFTENFTGQWLSLRKLKDTIPDKKLYPDFDEFLELSMPRETQLFFEEILKNDRSVLEFVHADWSMLNGRLAALYGIPDVHGSAFRKVQLPRDSHRGGVMTQSAVLRVTANGTNTSPVTRGTWVLDRILGTPAPPPPQDVPAIEPDIRGAKTIRAQLAKHRAIESCANCHAKIDPAGNALENFDVIGGWRTSYRVVPGKGFPQMKIAAPLHSRFVGVGKGPPVQAADELPGGRKFADVDGFKKLILENPEQFARNLTQKLLIYGTGHEIELADRAAVERIVAEVRARNYGFRTLVHAIVQSPTFRSK